MNKFIYIALVVLGFIVVFTVIYLFAMNNPVGAPSEQNSTETTNSQAPDFRGREEVLKNALNLYIQKKQEGVDMSKGPCLGNATDDWVVDIVHKPRIQADDDPKNKCPDFVSGKAKHYVELDPEGNLIRAD